MNKPSSYSSESNLGPIRALANTSTDYRALVCVYLNGGNDSHNMILPRAGSPNRAIYDSERGSLAVAAGTELPLTADWGINPNMPGMKSLFDAGKMGVLMNVGYLKEPTNRASFTGRTVTLPKELFSHNSQTELWQALPAFAGLSLTGWMGRAADLVGDVYNPTAFNDIGPCFSIAGRRTQMQGYELSSSDLNAGGPVTINAGATYGIAGQTAALAAARTQQGHENVLQRLLAERIRKAIANQAALAQQLQNLPGAADARFTALAANSLAQQLKTVARIIASRSALGHRRDLFYVTLGGWDDHENLALNYGTRLALVDAALTAFYQALDDMMLAQNVIAFTESEFGRALKENTGGSDHGWGGHALIVGGSVKGGKLFGTPPSLIPGNPQDAGQGRLIPTTSVEQYVGGLLNWWGIPKVQLSLVLENLQRFPAGILDIANEPVPAIPAPTYNVGFMNGAIEGDPTLKVVYGSDVPRTVFNEKGEMAPAAVNLVDNSEFIGAAVGTMPPGISTGIAAGIQHQVVGVGENSKGERYIDIRVSGKNAGGSTAYAHISFRMPTVASFPLGTPGQRMVFSLNAQIIAGSADGIPSNNPYLTIFWLNGASGTYVSEAASASITTDAQRVVSSGAFPLTGADRMHGVVSVAVEAGKNIDITFRLSQPQLEFSLSNASRAGRPTKYKPTRGTKFYADRHDFDPRTKKPLGLLTERPATNYLRNAGFDSAAIGTPGTLPTYAGFDTLPAGVSVSLVNTGMDSGMPFIDLRFFGKPTDTNPIVFKPDTVAAPVIAGANEDWAASIYAKLIGGSMSNITAATLELVGRAAGVSKQSRTVSLLGIGNGRLPTQQFQVQQQFTDATVNTAEAALRLVPTQNQPIDLTIRLACPQLEKNAYATSWIPTWGATVTRPNESLQTNSIGTWLNPSKGTMAIRAVSGMPNTTGSLQYPVLADISDGTNNNRIGNSIQVGGGTHGTDAGNIWAASVRTAVTSAGTAGVAAGLIAQGEVGTRVSVWDPTYFNVSQKGLLGAPVVPAGLPAGLTRLTIAGTGTGFATRVWVQDFRYWNDRLSDAQVALITSS